MAAPIHLPSVGETPQRFRRDRARARTPVTMCGCVETPEKRIATRKAQIVGKKLAKLCAWCLARARKHPQLFNAAVARCKR